MNHNIQPIPSPAGKSRRSRWQRPVIGSIFAIGLLFAWGNSEAQAQLTITGTAGNATPAQIINNELSSLYGISDISGATTTQIEAALTAALYQFPAPNPVNIADNPNGAQNYPNYTPEDLTNYILLSDTARATIAAAVVKTAITALETSGSAYPSVYTLGVVEKMTAGAAAIIANELPGSAAATTAIDTLITQAVTYQPQSANAILQEVINEITTTPPTNPSVSGLVGQTLSQTLAVSTAMATINAEAKISPSNALSTAIGAIATTGTFFESAPTVTGTALSANQSFVLAAVKAAPTTIPGITEAITQEGEQFLIGGPITSATGAVAYATKLVSGAPTTSISNISQAISSYITGGVAAQAYFAQLLTTGSGVISGALGTKATAGLDGQVLGGVIANDPSNASQYIQASGIYAYITSNKTLGTDANRINFVNGALAPVATSGSAVSAILNGTILNVTVTGTSFQNSKTYATDFQSLLNGATKAVSTTPSSEAVVIDALYPANVISTGTGQGQAAITPAAFAADAVKSAGAAGYAAFAEFLNVNPATQANDSAMESTAASIASVTAGTYSINDAARAQIAIGLINALTTPNDATAAFSQVEATVPSTDTDAAKATFVNTVATQYTGNNTVFAGVLNAAFTATGNGAFGNVAMGAGDLAKLLPTYATNIASAAVAAQGAPTSASSNAFTLDAAIVNSIVAGTVLKYPNEAAMVAGTAAATLAANDSNTADYATFAQDVIGFANGFTITGETNLSSSTTTSKNIVAGIAQALAAAGKGDSDLETFASDLTTDLGKNPDQIAGGVAQVISASAAPALADYVAYASGSTGVTEAIRAKIGAAVAFSQPSYAAQIVGALISGSAGGQAVLAPLAGVTTQQTLLAAAIAAQAPAQAGAIAQQVYADMLSDSNAADAGTVAGTITKAVPTTLDAADRLTDIQNIVTDTLQQNFNGAALASTGTNLVTFLAKVVSTTGASGGDLFSQAFLGDLGYASPGNDTAQLNTFTAQVAAKASSGTIYVAQGFAEYLGSTSAQLNYAFSSAVASGTTAAADGLKAFIAEGVALAATPNQAPAISSTVAATITDTEVLNSGTNTASAQYKLEIADNAARTAIAVDVSKAVPSQSLGVAYEIALQLDNTGANDQSYGTLAKAVATAVMPTLPKTNIAQELGAYASEVIMAAATKQQTAFALTPAQYATIIYDVAQVKPGTAYEVVGEGIATIAAEGIYTDSTAETLAQFESEVESIFATPTETAAIKAEVAAAVNAIKNNIDAFDVGPITRPETGVINS